MPSPKRLAPAYRTPKTENRRLLLTGRDLTRQDFADVVLRGRPVGLHPGARKAMTASRRVVERAIRERRVVYAVTTGVGSLSTEHIDPAQARQLQLNVVRSHCCGVGEPLTVAETRGLLLLRANTLAAGLSGIRPVIAEMLCAMLNHRLHPLVPSRGSVGASGDLAPLAHVALTLVGEGEVTADSGLQVRTKPLPARTALRRAGLQPLQLEAKEGISLVNGTQAMLSLGLLALAEAEALVDTADVAASLALDALRGSPAAFDPRLQEARPHPGQAVSARNLARLNEGSSIRESHRDCARLQDAYSLRCIPQVHGAVRDAIGFARGVFEIEMNSATDNPLVFAAQDEVLSGGNFHGQPVATALDLLAIALTQLGGISERRIDRMVNPLTSDLPPFLAGNPGLESGMMLAQVTAAALVSENKVLAHPASVDSIPTSGNKEDYVSMGMAAALKLKQIVANVTSILAIELLTASHALDTLAPLETGRLALKAKGLVRKVAAPLAGDRVHAPEIARVAEQVLRGEYADVLSPAD
jgi:histidine ammonia-lyase